MWVGKRDQVPVTGAVKRDFLRAATYFAWVVIGVATKPEQTFTGYSRCIIFAKKGKHTTEWRWAAMAETDRMSMAQRKIYLAEQIWLHYYNDYLFGKGMITEQERNKLKFKIDSRKPSAYC